MNLDSISCCSCIHDTGLLVHVSSVTLTCCYLGTKVVVGILNVQISTEWAVPLKGAASLVKMMTAHYAPVTPVLVKVMKQQQAACHVFSVRHLIFVEVFSPLQRKYIAPCDNCVVAAGRDLVDACDSQQLCCSWLATVGLLHFKL